jgi:glycosyltransferase 2 family protein
MKFNFTLIQKLAYILVFFATTYFMSLVLFNYWDEIKESGLTLNKFSLIAIMLFISAVSYSGLLWAEILRCISRVEFDTHHAVRAHCISWLLKYIPGQAGSFLGKIAWGLKTSIPKKVVISSFFYENILLLFSSLIISIPILLNQYFAKINSQLSLFLPVFALVPLFVVFYKPFFLKITGKIYFLMRNESLPEQLFLNSTSLFLLLVKYSLPRVLTGLGFIFVILSILPPDKLTLLDYISLGAAYVLAGIIGLIAIFTPGGIGVREAVIVLFASSHFTVGQSIYLALIARFYTLLADIILALIIIASQTRLGYLKR